MALQVGSLGGTCLWLVGTKPQGPSLIPGQGGPRASPLSPTFPLSAGSFSSRGFTTCPSLPKPPAGRAEAPDSQDESLAGEKPHPGGHNMVCSSCLSTEAWGGRGLPQGPRTRGFIHPCASPPLLFLLSSSLLSFSLSPMVLFGGCRAGSPTGMLWGNYAARVTVGCCPGARRGTGAGGCLSVWRLC